MARRKPKAEALEQEDRHTRCPWTQLKEQDRLLANQPAAVIAKQRRRCRAWLDGELSWPQLLGANGNDHLARSLEASRPLELAQRLLNFSPSLVLLRVCEATEHLV